MFSNQVHHQIIMIVKIELINKHVLDIIIVFSFINTNTLQDSIYNYILFYTFLFNIYILL